MKTTAKRFGGFAASVASVVAPQDGIDSSHGSAMVTPAPRRKVRREDGMLLTSLNGGFGPSLGQELGTCDNLFHHGVETVTVGAQFGAHGLDGRFVGQDQATAERIHHQFAAQRIDEVVLAMFANVIAYALQAASFAAAGKCGARIDRTARQILRAPLAD